MNARSLGECLISNEEFRAFFNQKSGVKRCVIDLGDSPRFKASPSQWHDGPLGQLARAGTCSPSIITDAERGLLHYESGDAPLTRATVTTTAGAVLTAYDRPPGVILLEQQPPTIAELLLGGTTGAPVVRYTKENTYTNAATAVAENAAKPEATFDLVEADATVRKIAVTAKVSDEAWTDFPAVQQYIDMRLRWMVAEKEDQHLLTGTGTGSQITGVLNTSGIQTLAVGSYPTVFDAIGHALGKVRSVGHYEPGWIVMNSDDADNLALTKDLEGRYYAGSPFGLGPGSFDPSILFRKILVPTTVMPRGTALVGARMGAQIFRRTGITLEITNSNEDDFKNNRLALRCEERLALATWRPTAFVQVTGIPA